jgi:transcriptional regulator with XRE-family HTH domain
MTERKISQPAMADLLNYSTGYINMLLNGKKNLTEDFLKSFCTVFNEFSLQECLVLLEREEGEKQGQGDTTKTDHTNTDQHSLHHNSNIQAFEISTKQNGLNQHFEKIASGMSNLSDEIQAELVEQFQQLLEATVHKRSKTYTHKELKELLLKGAKSWLAQSEIPSYNNFDVGESTDIEVEGILQLGHSSFYFTLSITKDYIVLVAPYKDRSYMDEFISLIPGWMLKENSIGNLGSIFKDTPLLTVRIFNLAETALKVKSLLATMGVNSKNFEIESFSIDSYFKS